MRSAYALALLLLGCTDGQVGPLGEGAPGPPGDVGAPGQDASASIVSVLPNRIFLDREVELAIRGEGTSWRADEPPQIDLGDGVALTSPVTVASPTALVATVQATSAAALGLRDLRVVDGDHMTRLRAAVTLDGPLRADNLFGRVAEGSGFVVDLEQLDRATPFDPNPDNYRFFLKDVDGPNSDGSLAVSFEVSDYHIAQAAFFVDVGALPASAVDNPKERLASLVVETGTGDEMQRSVAKNAVSIDPRPATPIGLGATAFSFIEPRDSRLLQFEIDALSVVTLEATSTPDDGAAIVFVLPPSGKFSENIGDDSIVSRGTFFNVNRSSFYAVLIDFSGVVPYDVELEVSAEPANVAQALPSPVTVDLADLPAFFEVLANAGDTIRATLSTSGGCPAAEHELTLLGTEGFDELARDVTFGCPEVAAQATASGVHYIQVSPPLCFSEPCATTYELAVDVQ